MKVKQQPEDFQVEELTEVVPGQQGHFSYYRLDKRGWATPDAIAVIRRRWNLERDRVSYGGLKDRHAVTVQYLSILHGPQRNLSQQGISVRYLGRLPKPFSSQDIQANRFQITLRDVRPEELVAAAAALDEVRQDGVPNYFDDQRFGSVVGNQEFVARRLIADDYEGALRLALAGHYEHDRAAQKREKAILVAHWGDWQQCKTLLSRGHARSLVDYLTVHPDDYRGAVARLRPDLRGLYLSAYQSYLWNRMLARALSQRCRPEQLVPVPLRLEPVPMHYHLDASQRTELGKMMLPLPSARLKVEDAGPYGSLIEAVLAEEGLQLSDIRIKAFRQPFFSKGERTALCVPAPIEHIVADDEVHPGRHKMLLTFDLPRGSYATLVIKRIQAACARSVTGKGTGPGAL